MDRASAGAGPRVAVLRSASPPNHVAPGTVRRGRRPASRSGRDAAARPRRRGSMPRSRRCSTGGPQVAARCARDRRVDDRRASPTRAAPASLASYLRRAGSRRSRSCTPIESDAAAHRRAGGARRAAAASSSAGASRRSRPFPTCGPRSSSTMPTRPPGGALADLARARRAARAGRARRRAVHRVLARADGRGRSSASAAPTRRRAAARRRDRRVGRASRSSTGARAAGRGAARRPRWPTRSHHAGGLGGVRAEPARPVPPARVPRLVPAPRCGGISADDRPLVCPECGATKLRVLRGGCHACARGARGAGARARGSSKSTPRPTRGARAPTSSSVPRRCCTAPRCGGAGPRSSRTSISTRSCSRRATARPSRRTG